MNWLEIHCQYFHSSVCKGSYTGNQHLLHLCVCLFVWLIDWLVHQQLFIHCEKRSRQKESLHFLVHVSHDIHQTKVKDDGDSWANYFGAACSSFFSVLESFLNIISTRVHLFSEAERYADEEKGLFHRHLCDLLIFCCPVFFLPNSLVHPPPLLSLSVLIRLVLSCEIRNVTKNKRHWTTQMMTFAYLKGISLQTFTLTCAHTHKIKASFR